MAGTSEARRSSLIRGVSLSFPNRSQQEIEEMVVSSPRRPTRIKRARLAVLLGVADSFWRQDPKHDEGTARVVSCHVDVDGKRRVLGCWWLHGAYKGLGRSNPGEIGIFLK